MIEQQWGQADFDNYSSDVARFDSDLGLIDSAISGAQEAWEYNPMQSLRKHMVAESGIKDKTAQQLNEKYGLINTPHAFKEEGDKMYSDELGEMRARLNVESNMRSNIDEKIKEDYGVLAPIAKFGGGLITSIADPINLGSGVSLGATRSLVTSGASAFGVLKKASKIMSGTKPMQKILADNFIMSAGIDGFITPLGEKAVGLEYGIEQRVFNVVAGTILGTAIDGAMSARSMARVRETTNGITKTLGGGADEVIQEATAHGVSNVAQGKKPNPDFVIKKKELEWNSTRPDQKAYSPLEIDSTNIGQAKWFVGAKADGNYDFFSSRGTGTVVVSDNFNLVHNRISPLDGKTIGEVHNIGLDTQDLNLLTRDKFDDVKQPLTKALEGDEWLMVDQLGKVMEESTNIGEFIEKLHGIVDDPKGLASVDDIVNAHLRDLGFDGYHFTQKTATVQGAETNGLAIFKAMGEEPKFTVDHTTKATKFDPQHPKSEEYIKPFRDMDLEENDRLRSPKSDLEYEEQGMIDVEKLKGEELLEVGADEVLEGQVDLESIRNGEGLRLPDEVDGDVFNEHIDRVKDMSKTEKIIDRFARCFFGS